MFRRYGPLRDQIAEFSALLASWEERDAATSNDRLAESKQAREEYLLVARNGFHTAELLAQATGMLDARLANTETRADWLRACEARDVWERRLNTIVLIASTFDNDTESPTDQP